MSKRGHVEIQRYRDRVFAPLSEEHLRHIKIQKLGQIEDCTVWHVDDEYLRNNVDIDFVLASNYAHSTFIPEGELWMSDLLTPNDFAACLVHEYTESECMTTLQMTYEKAHDVANRYEQILRDEIMNSRLHIRTTARAIQVAHDHVCPDHEVYK